MNDEEKRYRQAVKTTRNLFLQVDLATLQDIRLHALIELRSAAKVLADAIEKHIASSYGHGANEDSRIAAEMM